MNESAKTLAKFRHFRTVPFISGMFVELHHNSRLWIYIWNLRFACARELQMKWKLMQRSWHVLSRWDTFPASSSVCSHRRVWSHGPERRHGVSIRTEMLCDGKTRRTLVNASEMFTKTFPQSAPSLTDVNGRAATTGDAVNQTGGQASERIFDG